MQRCLRYPWTQVPLDVHSSHFQGTRRKWRSVKKRYVARVPCEPQKLNSKLTIPFVAIVVRLIVLYLILQDRVRETSRRLGVQQLISSLVEKLLRFAAVIQDGESVLRPCSLEKVVFAWSFSWVVSSEGAACTNHGNLAA